MIKDLDLLKDIAPLFKKKIVIWGVGYTGRLILKELKAMGAGNKGIYLCDTYAGGVQNEMEEKILLPEMLKSELYQVNLEDVIFLVTVKEIKAQDEILKKIENTYGDAVDIYTEYAIKWGIYFNINHPYIKKDYRFRKLNKREEERICNRSSIDKLKLNAFRYFSFLPLHDDEIILIYQVGKVGSSTIYNTLQNYNRYALHCHTLAGIEQKENDLYNLVNMKSGKIITLVRDPIARLISAMWQVMCETGRYSLEADFFEVENYFFGGEGFENVQFEWFHNEIEKIFKIDVFQYSFNQEKGYSIIKKGNIELLLIKMEKLNELENVIGEFLGIEQFHMQKSNEGKEKTYRFAYRAYQESFASVSKEKLEDIYLRNEYMRFFYSEQERQNLYNKWMQSVN